MSSTPTASSVSASSSDPGSLGGSSASSGALSIFVDDVSSSHGEVSLSSFSPPRDGDATNLPWASLIPDDAAKPLPGGMGIVFKARWLKGRSTSFVVAVKLLRGGALDDGTFVSAVAGLESEAMALQAISRDNINEHVVKFCGVARGLPTDAWRARLGGLILDVLGPSGDRELIGIVMK